MPKDKQQIEHDKQMAEEAIITDQQAVDASQEVEKDLAKSTAYLAKEEISVDQTKSKKMSEKKSTGKGIAFLAVLIAIAVSGASYYLTNEKLNHLTQFVTKATQDRENIPLELPNFEVEKAQLDELSSIYKKSLERIEQLEQEQAAYTNKIDSLQAQLSKLSGIAQSDSVIWKLSDADFLLNNALRKMVLDNDIDTTKKLLLEADAILAQVPNDKVADIREAIRNDWELLANMDVVDQNSLMQQLTTLANSLDDLPMLSSGPTEDDPITNSKVSDSINDWQQNIEKSASSFLDHFIRVTDRNKADAKVFIAPNQEIYLRENIRLRLQIAILAVPRQQNELYKQSIDAVSTWIRSYFDTHNENVKNFLKELDDLAEQSVYIDAPNRLGSLVLLEQLLNKTPKAIDKIEIKAEKALPEPTDSEVKRGEANAEAIAEDESTEANHSAVEMDVESEAYPSSGSAEQTAQ
ncbi:HemX protein [[Haemophilus] ducreyi]|uniref:uroporphyrinogen-III C-methyltransferase n=1 Tax=Haemophilus ducreyi TaxID=730 RepID=UPI000656469E|nr:uroporphyrinogen-III C-methyltransferase [[Haemophilus] ducreyi]AKO37161.1 HemX protein [[Haemophilus] ducreyi]AKO38619.1 HemX protein [[Haemophilus] ducreyi]AKO41644.1 HemX protein [[Haemophilus] ducreyi]AKO43070.1 HemX protein [[Haemophilus] ducreyi]